MKSNYRKNPPKLCPNVIDGKTCGGIMHYDRAHGECIKCGFFLIKRINCKGCGKEIDATYLMCPHCKKISYEIDPGSLWKPLP